MKYKTQLKIWADRRKRIVAMAQRKGPRSYHIVGRAFGITRQRVRQIVDAENGR